MPFSSSQSDNLRSIRILIYVTTIAYSVFQIVNGPSMEPAEIVPGAFTSPVLGAVLGTSQLLVASIGIVLELSWKQSRRYTKAISFVLAVTYLYETVLELVIGRSVFEWLPFAVYSALASIIYLSEG